MKTAYIYLIFIAPSFEVAQAAIDELLAELPSFSAFSSFGSGAYRGFRETGRQGNFWEEGYGKEAYPGLPQGTPYYGELSKIPLSGTDLKDILVSVFSDWESAGVFPAVCQVMGEGIEPYEMLHDHRVGRRRNSRSAAESGV